MTTRHAFAACAVAIILAAGAAALVLLGDHGPQRADNPAARSAAARTLPPPRPRVPADPLGARVLRRTQLRSSPGGPVVRAIGTKTGYQSGRVLAVVERRGDWLGVLSDHVANARTAWILADSARVVHMRYRLDVDLSARRVLVRREGRVVRRFKIAIGRANTSTPIGRFAVTDALRISGGSGAYGCCALALTARQPNLPQGWGGGDRIAIHGTSATGSIGSPASGGCMRASDISMRWLMKKIGPGVQVHVRA